MLSHGTCWQQWTCWQLDSSSKCHQQVCIFDPLPAEAVWPQQRHGMKFFFFNTAKSISSTLLDFRQKYEESETQQDISEMPIDASLSFARRDIAEQIAEQWSKCQSKRNGWTNTTDALCGEQWCRLHHRFAESRRQRERQEPNWKRRPHVRCEGRRTQLHQGADRSRGRCERLESIWCHRTWLLCCAPLLGIEMWRVSVVGHTFFEWDVWRGLASVSGRTERRVEADLVERLKN